MLELIIWKWNQIMWLLFESQYGWQLARYLLGWTVIGGYVGWTFAKLQNKDKKGEN